MRSNSLPSSLYLMQSLPAWIAIIGLVFISAGCIVIGAGSILRFAFPICSLVVGLFLYLRYPILYVSFTWWLWFLTPWLRRVIDYRSGWDPQGIILLSPFLVTLITIITFLRHLPKAYRQGGLPFILACASVFYGFFIGLLLNDPPIVVLRAFLDWLTPVLFGFHLFMHWRDYPKLRQNVQHTFFWCVLITGIYGVYQFLIGPEWDCLWIIKTELLTNGRPEPFGIRVFSTMNSPGPFSVVMTAGLLLLFNSKGVLRLFGAMVGYLSFLLALVRITWGGWLVGFLTLVTSLKAHLQIRLLISIILIVIFVLPLANVEPFSQIISKRFESISDVKNDQSFSDRSETYNKKLNLALSSLTGNGLGSVYHVNEKGILEMVVLDSGILDMFFALGWFGAIPYLSGIILLLLSLFQGVESSFDPFIATARAISLGTFVELIGGSTMLALAGLVLWGFLGISLAGKKYYKYQGGKESFNRSHST